MLGHAQLDQRAVERQQAELKDYTYELLFELYDNKGGVLGLLSLVELHIPRSRPMSSFMISFVPAQIFVTRASFHARAARYSFMYP